MTWKVAKLNKRFIVYIDREKVDDVIFVEWIERNEKNVVFFGEKSYYKSLESSFD